MINSDELTYRPACEDDLEFLRDLYASSRDWEMRHVALSERDKHVFLDQQFALQNQHYRKTFKRAAFQIIVLGEQDVGRLIRERTKQCIRIIDITLSPHHRGAGIGTHSLEIVLREAQSARLPVKLSVRTENTAAQRLYFRQGFTVQSIKGGYAALQWTPTPA